MPLVNNKLILSISPAINLLRLSLQKLNSRPKIDHLETFDWGRWGKSKTGK